MTFGAVFPRVLRPVFGPGLAVSAAAANWWEAGGATGCVAAYQPKGAASLAASYTNLANPGTYDAAPGVAPTWDATNGWTFANTQYLTTGVVLSGTSSALVRFSNDSGNNQYLFGALQSGAGILISPNRTLAYVWYYSTTALQIAPNVTSGVLGIAAPNGGKAYRNGVEESGSMAAWTGALSVGLHINGFNNNGSSAARDTVYIQAFAAYSGTLSAPQMAAISTAMAAL